MRDVAFILVVMLIFVVILSSFGGSIKYQQVMYPPPIFQPQQQHPHSYVDDLNVLYNDGDQQPSDALSPAAPAPAAMAMAPPPAVPAPEEQTGGGVPTAAPMPQDDLLAPF